MFVPKYTISNSILKNIGIIDGAREVILNAPLIPVWEARFRREALEKTVHFGTHLEGNNLSLENVGEVLDGKTVVARERDVQEVINYRNVLKYLDTLTAGVNQSYTITIDTLLQIHQLVTEKILPIESSGKFRVRQVVIKNSLTGEVSYTPPPAAEVPYLVEDLIEWINSEESKELHPVLKAGIVHYELARIHPFVDGNGRVARAMATLALFLDNYDIRRFFSLEEYFDTDPMNYYVTLQSVSNQKVLDHHERDLTPWLNYFVEGVAIELNKIKERVRRISIDSRVKDRLGEQLTLNERQMLLMEYLHRHKAMQNKDFRKIFPDYSDDTVLRELRFLAKKGLIKKTGGTKMAKYELK